MKNNKVIIKDIERRIVDWKDERIKISGDQYRNYLHGQQIDYSICDIVIQELLELLRFANCTKDEVKG